MKEYLLYITNCSNHNSLITKNANNEPFKTKKEAIEYGKRITGNTVYLIEGKKSLIHC